MLKCHKDFQLHSIVRWNSERRDKTNTEIIIFIIIEHYSSSPLLFLKAPTSKRENKNKNILKCLVRFRLLKLKNLGNHYPHSSFAQGKPEAQRATCKWSRSLMAELGLEIGNINSQTNALKFIPPKKGKHFQDQEIAFLIFHLSQ